MAKRIAIDYPALTTSPDDADLIHLHQASSGQDRSVSFGVLRPDPVSGSIGSTAASQGHTPSAANTWDELVITSLTAGTLTNMRQMPGNLHRLQVWRTGTDTSPVGGNFAIQFGMEVTGAGQAGQVTVLLNGTPVNDNFFLTAATAGAQTAGTVWPMTTTAILNGLVDGDYLSIGIRNPDDTAVFTVYKPTLIFQGQEAD
jgi:hypothetical protein